MRASLVFARTIRIAMILLFVTRCGASQPGTVSSSSSSVPTAGPVATEALQGSPAAATPALSKATRHALFSQAWTLIHDRYVYADYGGVDWNAVREEYSKKVASAASDDEFYDLMREMVGKLGDAHSSFLSPEGAALEVAIHKDLAVPGGIGVHIAENDGELVIMRVLPDNPAAGAGLKPGERILAVDGVLLDRFASTDEVILTIVGEAGTEVVLSVRSLEGEERDIAITRGVVELENAMVRERVIEGTKVGLLTIDGFDSPDTPDIVRERLLAVLSIEALKGLIVDVRANPGGYIDGGSISTESGREEESEVLVPAGRTMPLLEGLPVVVLSGPYTSSAAESFVAGMQVHGRAKVVGQPTAGNTESISWHQLSDGSVLRIAEWIYKPPDGAVIEGRGVQPDVVVEGDLWQYDGPDDPQLKAAIELLGSE
jgi:carboxyl-terminal processing protease